MTAEEYDYLRESVIWLKNNFLSVILLIVVLYAMFSGKLKQWFERIKRAKRVKAGIGGVDIEFDGMSEQSAKTFKTMWGKFDNLAAGYTAVQDKLGDISKSADQRLDCLQGKIEDIAQKQSGMFIDQLKLLFYNNALNDEERLIAGLRYVHLGHNHKMRKDIINFAIEHPAIYKGACVAKPAFRISEVDKALGKGVA